MTLLKRILLILLFLLSSIVARSQKEAAIWYFGERAGLDFNSGSPVALLDGSLNTNEGCATIANESGKLLLYTDGKTIWDRTHGIMQNGEGLLGHESSSQSAIIIPKPGDSNLYYVFTVYFQALGGLNYSVVDISANGGLGTITQKNIELDNQTSEKLTAVLHANGNDVWVLAHDYGNDAFQAYLVTGSGVSSTPVVSNAGTVIDDPNFDPVTNGSFKTLGTMKVSPAGNKLAICHWGIEAQVLDFDSATGKVSNPITLSQGAEIYFGAEFSPSGKVLYISTRENVFQYDITATDIKASEVAFFPNEFFPRRAIYGLQLGIDGKLYAANMDRSALSVINKPNILGLAADLQLDAVPTQRTVRLGLPPFIQSFFYVSLDITDFCFGDETKFDAQANDEISSVLWDFGDGTTSTEEQTAHTYKIPGTYTVKLTVTAQDGKQSTEEEEIRIYTPPVANTPAAIDLCISTDTYAINLDTKKAEVLGNQSENDYYVSIYKSENNALNKKNPLPEVYEARLGTETLFVRIENAGYDLCFTLTSFDLDLKKAPLLQEVSDWVVCAPGDTFDFDLTQKETEILNGQDQSVFSVSYYLTEADAVLGIHSIKGLYQNKVAAEKLFFRIENKLHKECFEVGSYQIQVFDDIAIPQIPDLLACDRDNDGYAFFDLSSQNNTVLDGKDPKDFVISYYDNQEDADYGMQPLNPFDFRNTKIEAQKLFVKLVPNSSSVCYATQSFNLRVTTSPSVSEVTTIEVCDENNDGQEVIDLTGKRSEVLGGQQSVNFEVTFHNSQTEANTGSNAILEYTASLGLNVVFYRKVNRDNQDCYNTGTFDIWVYKQPVAQSVGTMVACAESNQLNYMFNLGEKDAEVLGSQNPNEFVVTYFASEEDVLARKDALDKSAYVINELERTVYALVENKQFTNCFDYIPVRLLVNKITDPPLEESYVICPDSPRLNLNGGNYETYFWYTSSGNLLSTEPFIEIDQIGTYTLEVSRSLEGKVCFAAFSFAVNSSGAPDDFTTTVEGFSDRLSLVIDATGVGEFEYSVDGFYYQDSPQFSIAPGEYTAYVRDKILCRTLTQVIIALGYSKFFTPNGDGYHDTWNITGAGIYNDAQVLIFDRFGKLLKEVNPKESGWDGTYRGLQLPSSEYWFRFNYEGGKEFTGHFSLKR